jgi:hypothetical protein
LVAAAAPLEVPFRPVEVAVLGILFFPVEDVLRAPLVPLEVDLEDDLVRPLFALVTAFLGVVTPFDDLLRAPFALPDETLEAALWELLLPLETAFCEPFPFEVVLWPPFLLVEAAPRAPLVLLIDAFVTPLLPLATALLGPLFPPGAAF